MSTFARFIAVLNMKSPTEKLSNPSSMVRFSVSTPSVSMRMLPTLRVRTARGPLASRDMLSSTFAPLNTSVSRPAAALDDVAAVARVPDEAVVLGAEVGLVGAAVAVDAVVAGGAEQRLVAVAAEDDVVARPPSSVVASSANAPLTWSILIRSLPAPASTWI